MQLFNPFSRNTLVREVFLEILEESGVAKFIHNEKESIAKAELGGRPSYNPYRLFATKYLLVLSKQSLLNITSVLMMFLLMEANLKPTQTSISLFGNQLPFVKTLMKT